MHAIRNAALVVVLSAAAMLSATAPARADSGDTFAAIAYSPSTGHVGYAYNAGSRGEAEDAALAQCDRFDGQVIAWVKNGYVAMFVGDDGSYGYAWGSSRAIAESIAGQQCRDAGGAHPRLVVSIYSGD